MAGAAGFEPATYGFGGGCAPKVRLTQKALNATRHCGVC